MPRGRVGSSNEPWEMDRAGQLRLRREPLAPATHPVQHIISTNPAQLTGAAEYFQGRTDVQCLHRWQKVLNPELVKGPWTKEVRLPGVVLPV